MLWGWMSKSAEQKGEMKSFPGLNSLSPPVFVSLICPSKGSSGVARRCEACIIVAARSPLVSPPKSLPHPPIPPRLPAAEAADEWVSSEEAGRALSDVMQDQGNSRADKSQSGEEERGVKGGGGDRRGRQEKRLLCGRQQEQV